MTFNAIPTRYAVAFYKRAEREKNKGAVPGNTGYQKSIPNRKFRIYSEVDINAPSGG
jgi:hypothetical protein